MMPLSDKTLRFKGKIFSSEDMYRQNACLSMLSGREMVKDLSRWEVASQNACPP